MSVAREVLQTVEDDECCYKEVSQSTIVLNSDRRHVFQPDWEVIRKIPLYAILSSNTNLPVVLRRVSREELHVYGNFNNSLKCLT